MSEDKQSKPIQCSEPDEKVRFEKLQFFMDYYGRYHDHKENMAWVATAFYLGGIVYLTNALHGLACHSCTWLVTFSVLILIAGGFAFAFVDWQFKRRKEAADKARDCYDQLMLMLSDFPSADKEVKDRWLYIKSARPHETRCLSVLAIIGITIAAIVILNIWCSCN